MPAPKKEPEWVALFLAALGACGNVTRSAELAGVDVSGPYNRRNRYPDFKEAWERVVAERALRAAPHSTGSGHASTSSVAPQDERALEPQDERGLVCGGAAGVRLGRRARSRWTDTAEATFLEELTASANVARAAAAVGFSAAAIYKRKLRDRRFAEGWEAAIAVGRSRLEAHLLDAADRAFDPDALPIADGAPKVTVGEAINILRHKPAGSGSAGGRGRRRGDGYMDWVTDEDVDIMEQAAEARKSIYDKLARLLEQDKERKLAAGWTLHGEDWVPPGWTMTGTPSTGPGQA